MAFDLGAVIAHVKADTKDFVDGMNNARKEVNTFKDRMGSVTASVHDFGKQAAVFAGVAGAGIVAFGKTAVDSYHEAELASAQLVHAVRNVTKASNEELAATIRLADELERKGVLDGDNIKVGLAQLSTFGLSNKAVRALGGSLSDLAVNQFGVKASGDQLAQTANMIAKALNGQFGVLEKSGIRFTEAQRRAIEFGSEMEKVKAINEGFAQNLKLTNDVALTTMEGKLAAINVRWGNFQEAIGGVLSAIGEFALLGGSDEGIFNAIQELVSDDDLAGQITDAIVGMVNAFRSMGEWIQENKDLVITFLQGLGIALGVLMVIGTITALITALMNPLVLLSLGIAALYTAWKTNFWGIRDITTAVINAVTGTIQFFKNNWDSIWLAIRVILAVATGGISELLFALIPRIIKWGSDIYHALIGPFERAWGKISELMSKIKDALDFTKRHSPSILDVVQKGVRLVNSSLSDLNMPIGSMGMGTIGLSSPVGSGQHYNSITVDLSGAMIADESGAERIGEMVGDSIIRKLQTNVRF